MNHDVDSENIRNDFGMDAAAEWVPTLYAVYGVLPY